MLLKLALAMLPAVLLALGLALLALGTFDITVVLRDCLLIVLAVDRLEHLFRELVLCVLMACPLQDVIALSVRLFRDGAALVEGVVVEFLTFRATLKLRESRLGVLLLLVLLGDCLLDLFLIDEAFRARGDDSDILNETLSAGT